MHGPSPDEAAHEHHEARPWHKVLWLTGVDYFSTLGYQPGIALLAAHALSPIATAFVVLVTLFGALPIYTQVARRSYVGQGSIAMLERLLPGWSSKLMILALIGFASTDFVITMTLSAADAAHHIVENPLAREVMHGAQVWITLGLLALLAAVFLGGFSEAIGLAVLVGVPYILLNLVVVVRSAIEIANRPELLGNWTNALSARGDWTFLLLTAGLVFPKLALGLSGFETGVAVMPLIKGDPGDRRDGPPPGRIRGTRKLLTTAAVIMSVLLLSTSFITAVLIPRAAYDEGGAAAGRALAYLAHGLLGNGFGTVYDLSTILILWFAGSSAMAGMLHLIPRYLPRLGMAPRWVAYARPLVLALFTIDVVVTLVFRADVEAQGGAYATGVLALMLSAAVAVTLALREEAREATPARRPWAAYYFGLVSLVFAYTLVQNVRERPDGLIIASVFIVTVVVVSGLSRYSRRTEMRVESFRFTDAESERLWGKILGKQVYLVPLKCWEERDIQRKGAEIRQHYGVSGQLAYLHTFLADDRSDFVSQLRVKVRRRGEDYTIEVSGAVALANTIAYISELIDPIRLFLGLTRQNSVSQALRYLVTGEGETGILVYEILLRHWQATPEEDIRPLIFLMSD